LQIDADTKRAHFPDRFQYNAGHANLVEREGCCQPTNAATGDHNIGRHKRDPICKPVNFISVDSNYIKPTSRLEPRRAGRQCPLLAQSGTAHVRSWG
jgi:hypothetical protein